jgi:LacI family transcriptional regulator
MKPVSMQDVARACGVSKNSVSLALRHSPQIPERTRRRIEKAAARLGYRKNAVVSELMARLHAGGSRRFQCTLALINANRDPEAFSTHPTIPVYVEGCQRRAAELGYELDPFWLHEPGISASRWSQIFRARGIPGAILVGLMEENRLPESFRPLTQEFPMVVTGVRTRDPSLSFACVDHHMVALRAMEKVTELGYQRPGLVLDARIDALVEHRFSAGYVTGQQTLPAKNRLRPFLSVEQARNQRSLFNRWLETQKPDVIFTLYREVKAWVEASGWRVPDDVLLVQYEWRKNCADWPGMDQHNDLAGQAAVDLLVGMIHRAERGPPPFPLATLIGPTWREGSKIAHRPSRPSFKES